MNSLCSSWKKVSCPVLPAIYLHREALVHHMSTLITGAAPGMESEGEAFPYKLVLLHAPAGYGKTTLLADFARQSNLPCCWYFLDQTDTDCVTFLTYLLMSIRQCFPDFGHGLDALLGDASSGSMSHGKMFVDRLVGAVETEIVGRFALLLCNYHEINEVQEINALINYLLQKLPSHCVLVIESRTIPNLDFVHLLAGQMISSVGSSQLRFTAQQIHELAMLQQVEALSAGEAQQLAITFDGWIAGMLSGTRLGDVSQFRQTWPPFAAAVGQQNSSHDLFSSVVNEIFKDHRQAYTFLKEACVLQEMTPLLCANLLDISPYQAQTQLRYLEQQNLFVTHRGEGTEPIYTCIPALRTLLCEQLRAEASERYFYLHRRAAELLSRSQNYPQAIYHALEANSNEIAVNQIIEAYEQMMNQGHAMILARWIDTFSPAPTKSYAQLLLIRAHIFLRQGDYTSALPLLDTVDSCVQLMAEASPLDMQSFLPLRAEIAIVRSRIFFQQGEYQQSRSLCQQVPGSLPPGEVKLRAQAHMQLGLCSLQLGDFSAGITDIQKALQLWGRHTIQRQTAEGHGALATAYSLSGNFTLAEHHISRALACWEQLNDSRGKIESRVILGNIRLRQGTVDEAERLFREALTEAQSECFLHGQAYALAGMSLCYHRQERDERALETAEEALALARQINDQILVNTILCDLAMTYLTMGDTVTPLILIAEVKTQTTRGEAIGYRNAVRDLVYGTIYLYLGQYNQAWPYLSTSEAMLSKIGLKEESLQSLLRLAACHLAQGDLRAALRCLQTAVTITPICEGYEHLARRELRHLPALDKAIRTIPELERIRTVLHLEPIAAGGRERVLEQKHKHSSVSPAPASAAPMPTHQLIIRALGEPAVYLHQEPITRWRMARAMELFFYLLDCRQPARKEAIISTLWEQMDEQTTRTFYSTVYYLRQALGGEAAIAAKGGTYTLKLDDLYGKDVWYDVATFEDWQLRAKQSLMARDEEEARSSYQAMVDLYRGDYVQLFASDWCSPRRDELRNAYLEAHHQLALIAWRAEQLDESIFHWQRMLACDSCLERAHYGLMRCYVQQEKRGVALSQYRCYKEALKREFDAVPGTSIQNLYQRLKGRS